MHQIVAVERVFCIIRNFNARCKSVSVRSVNYVMGSLFDALVVNSELYLAFENLVLDWPVLVAISLDVQAKQVFGWLEIVLISVGLILHAIL